MEFLGMHKDIKRWANRLVRPYKKNSRLFKGEVRLFWPPCQDHAPFKRLQTLEEVIWRVFGKIKPFKGPETT